MALIDVDRYPIDRLDTSIGCAFVADCARRYAAQGVLVLPGFLTEETVAAIAEEAQREIGNAFFSSSAHTVFLDAVPDIAARTTLSSVETTRLGSIAADRLDPKGALRRLHDAPELTAFVAAVLGFDSLFPGADALGAVSVNVYRAGDGHGWHFDEAAFSVTLMIQAAEVGGEFEYVTGLRDDRGADVAAIAAVRNSEHAGVRTLDFPPGSLSIFAGRHTMHRVTTVEGEAVRLVPVLTYDTVPGSVNSEHVRRMFWGRSG